MRQGRNHQLATLCAGAMIFCAGLSDAAANEPDPHEILATARLASSSQQAAVRGQLRAGGTRTPFVLRADYERLRFDFVEDGRTFEVHLGEESSAVLDKEGRPMKRGMQEPVVEGSDVTVEDLSLGFLYWPDATVRGRETVRSRGTWVVDLRPGRRGSEFAVVRVWVDRDSGALMRIEGFDRQGRLLRRFEVVSGQRIGGRWMLKQMRVERFNPENPARPEARSYLEILGREET
jgi:hypothetical protein